MEELFSGRSVLTEADYRPVCVRVAWQLYKFVQLGKKPRRNTTGFVEWDERKFKSIADHAVNIALDSNQNWVRKNSRGLQQAIRYNWNLHLCVDGARRGTGQSSGGLAIIVHGREGQRKILARAGHLWGYLPSAVAAELLTLEWAMNLLMDEMSQSGLQSTV